MKYQNQERDARGVMRVIILGSGFSENQEYRHLLYKELINKGYQIDVFSYDINDSSLLLDKKELPYEVNEGGYKKLDWFCENLKYNTPKYIPRDDSCVSYVEFDGAVTVFRYLKDITTHDFQELCGEKKYDHTLYIFAIGNDRKLSDLKNETLNKLIKKTEKKTFLEFCMCCTPMSLYDFQARYSKGNQVIYEQEGNKRFETIEGLAQILKEFHDGSYFRGLVGAGKLDEASFVKKIVCSISKELEGGFDNNETLKSNQLRKCTLRLTSNLFDRTESVKEMLTQMNCDIKEEEAENNHKNIFFTPKNNSPDDIAIIKVELRALLSGDKIDVATRNKGNVILETEEDLPDTSCHCTFFDYLVNAPTHFQNF